LRDPFLYFSLGAETGNYRLTTGDRSLFGADFPGKPVSPIFKIEKMQKGFTTRKKNPMDFFKCADELYKAEME
jgi:hypothetical protein